jgi:NAD(P)H-flavin reductase
LKRKVWDVFSNFTIEKLWTVFICSPLKDTQTVTQHLKNETKQTFIYISFLILSDKL